jgi:TPR repeat protein
MYQKGLGVSPDPVEAVKWFKKAAEQGLAAGQNNLGWMYEYGLGVSKNYAEAKKWYEKRAEQGKSLAKANLRNMPL